MKGETNAASGGGSSISIGDKLQFMLQLTLDGGDASKLNGATIIATDLNSGEVFNLAYNPAGVPFTITAGHNFKIVCKRAGLYSPPPAYTSVAGNGVEQNVTLNYNTVAAGVYIYTLDDRIVPVASYTEGATNAVGVCIVTSSYRFVIGPRLAPVTTLYPSSSTKPSGITLGYSSTIDNTQAIISGNFASTNTANYNVATNYVFKNGKKGSVPPGGYVRSILSDVSSVSKAYTAISDIFYYGGYEYMLTSSFEQYAAVTGSISYRQVSMSVKNQTGGGYTQVDHIYPYFNLE